MYKVELYIVDVNNEYSSLDEILNQYLDCIDCTCKGFHEQSKEIDWHDDIDINYSDATVDVYRKYFKGDDEG